MEQNWKRHEWNPACISVHFFLLIVVSHWWQFFSGHHKEVTLSSFFKRLKTIGKFSLNLKLCGGGWWCGCYFTVCTQLLVSRPDEENISSYLQLIDKCLIHEVSNFREVREGREIGKLLFSFHFLKGFSRFPRYANMTIWALILAWFRDSISAVGKDQFLPSQVILRRF